MGLGRRRRGTGFGLLDHLAQGVERLLMDLKAVVVGESPPGGSDRNQQGDHDQDHKDN
jgi:hypothetical protein